MTEERRYLYIALGSIHKDHEVEVYWTQGSNGKKPMHCVPCNVLFIGIGRCVRRLDKIMTHECES